MGVGLRLYQGRCVFNVISADKLAGSDVLSEDEMQPGLSLSDKESMFSSEMNSSGKYIWKINCQHCCMEMEVFVSVLY